MLDSGYDFNVPHRQNPLGIVVYLLRNFRALISVFFALVAIMASNPNFWIYLPAILIPIAVLVSVLAYLQFRNFTFRISGDEVLIQKGIFVKNAVRIPIERIQSIQVTEHIVQRVLGLVAIKIDTAGSKGNELEIPALNRALANIFKDYLYAKKAEQEVAVQTEGQTEAPDNADGLQVAQTIAAESTKTLLSLSIIDLLKVGLTENHLRTAVIALAFVIGTLSQYQDFIEERFGNEMDVYADKAVSLGFRLVIFIAVLYAAIAIMISVVRVFLRFYGFKAELNSETIEISTGLLKRQEHRVPIRKIQYLKWEGNPLRRLIGFESVKVKPSNSLGATANAESIEIPALKAVHTDALVDSVFPEYQVPHAILHANPAAYARFAVIISAVLIGMAALPIGFLYSWYSLGLLALVLPIAAIAYLFGKTVKLSFDGQYLQVSKGRLFTSRAIMHSYKVQAISLSQSVFLRRRNLGHVALHTAAGDLSVRYFNFDELTAFRDFMVYAVERDKRDWM